MRSIKVTVEVDVAAFIGQLKSLDKEYYGGFSEQKIRRALTEHFRQLCAGEMRDGAHDMKIYQFEKILSGER